MVCERRVPFGDRSPESSKHHLSWLPLCLLGDQGAALFSISLHPASDEKGSFVMSRVDGRSKPVLRKCLCTCGDYFHQDADHSCETKTIQRGCSRQYGDDKSP
ncbi:hypothetical protein TNCV_4585901 [Trichonephila clavipes]|nr:hypothetical protein TNCV_4585901 [Trichonephila clavipes]